MNAKDMMHHVIQFLVELLNSPKIAMGVSATSVGTGIGLIFEWIPNDIGKVAALFGVILTITIIRLNWLKIETSKFELELMKTKEDERLRAAALRKHKRNQKKSMERASISD